MKKQIFALASITALAGLISPFAGAGCKTVTTTYMPVPIDGSASPTDPAKGDTGSADDDDPDGRQDSAKKDANAGDPPKKPDASTPKPDASTPKADASTGGTCPSTDPFDRSTAPYTPAAARDAKCTSTEIDNFVASVNANAPDFSLLSSACKTCVTRPNSAIDLTAGRVNQAGCIERETNSTACAEAANWTVTCLNAACDSCDQSDEAAVDQCFTDSQQTVCNAELQNLDASCPGGISSANSALSACDLGGILRAFCL